GPQAVAVGNQDHGRVAMPVATMLPSTVHQPVNLTLGEVAPLNCQVYDAWGAFLGCRFHADKPSLRGNDCVAYTPFLDSHKGRIGGIKRIGIAMQMETLGRRVRHEAAARAARLACAEAPLGGTFRFQIFLKASSPEILSETISGSEEALARKWDGLF